MTAALVALLPFGQSPASVQLDVPAIAQEPGCPKEGWCGEAAIQMIGLYHGLYAPQRTINLLGHPSHPDLWSNELPATIQALGLESSQYTAPKTDLTDFERSFKADLAKGLPVLLGVGVYSHGQGQYHFVVARSYDDAGLGLNDTWGFRPASLSWSQMRVRKEGIGYPNDESGYFGITVRLPARLSGRTARLAPLDAASFFGEESVRLKATLSGLEPRRAYQILRYGSMDQAAKGLGGTVVGTLTAAADKDAMTISIPRKSVSVIRFRVAER